MWGRGAFAMLAGVLLYLQPCAFALDPKLEVNQYAHHAWKVRDGFSKGGIWSIAQTPDGYLWLGTDFGLMYFDGVNPVSWQPPPDQPLPSNEIMSLLAARDGTLWIGTTSGLASWKNGRLTQYSELAGRQIFALLEDHDGTIWATGNAITTGRLCSIRNGNAQCYGDDGSLGRGAFNLYEDSKGNLWAGVKTGLWRWKPGPPKFYPLAGEIDGIQALGEDGDGTLLVGWKGGISRFIEGKTEAFQLTGSLSRFRPHRILRDRDGGLWIGTATHGVFHVHQGRTDMFAQSDSLSGDAVTALFEDHEGNIWVTTSGGLDRFHDFAVATLTPNQGLSSALVGAVLADRDGSVWLSTRSGLNRWNNGPIKTYRNSGSKPNDLPESLFQDDRGRIWLSTLAGFGYLENGKFIAIKGVPGGNVLSIAQDRTGNLWIANERLGLFRASPQNVIRQIPWTTLGRKDQPAFSPLILRRTGYGLDFFSAASPILVKVRFAHHTPPPMGWARVVWDVLDLIPTVRSGPPRQVGSAE